MVNVGFASFFCSLASDIWLVRKANSSGTGRGVPPPLSGDVDVEKEEEDEHDARVGLVTMLGGDMWGNDC